MERSDPSAVEIEIDFESDIDDQLDQLADDFALSQSQVEDVRSDFEALVEERAPNADAEQRESMMHILLSSLRQTLEQIDEPPESYL